MSVINTNYLALVSQNNLTKSQSALGTAIERLSSGMRINSAKDDAAGQAIANRFTANIKGLTQAARNANDGVSIAQTTEGALNEINNNLQRIRELTVQAANGSNSDVDRASIQNEIKERLDEIDRVSRETQFNGKYVLGDNGESLDIQVGANDGQTITINLARIDAAELNLDTFTVAGDSKVTSAQMQAIFGAEVTGAQYKVGADTYDIAADGTVTSGTDAVYVDASGGLTTDATTANTPYDTLSADDITSIATAANNNGNANVGDTFEAEINGVTTTFTVANNKLDANGDGTVTFELEGKTITLTISDADDVGGNANVTVAANTLFLNAAGDLTTEDEVDNDTATRADVEGATGSTLLGETLEIASGEPGAGTYTVLADGTVENEDGDALYLSRDADGEPILVTAEDAQQATENPLAALDAALQKVDDLRSHLGAIQNRFESTIANLNNTVNNLSAARSRIEDADYAVEVSNMTRAQILQQAGTSVLAQANQVPQTVLSLLR